LHIGHLHNNPHISYSCLLQGKNTPTVVVLGSTMPAPEDADAGLNLDGIG